MRAQDQDYKVTNNELHNAIIFEDNHIPHLLLRHLLLCTCAYDMCNVTVTQKI